jgi:hypothetical protein
MPARVVLANVRLAVVNGREAGRNAGAVAPGGGRVARAARDAADPADMPLIWSWPPARLWPPAPRVQGLA